MSTSKLKIVFIVPGSGDSFYCGNCFRDSLHANALKRAGHDVVVMPLYLPLRDQSFPADSPLFFPATSVYLAQKFFRKKAMPRWMERMLNSEFSLNMASTFSGTTSSEGMEDMTLSMIQGDDAVFQQQVHTLVSWLKEQEQPDIIHLSSSLIIGIAQSLRQAMPRIPIVCSLQDEEVWIDTLNEADAQIAWQGIVDKSRYIDRFITSSQFYKDYVAKRLPQIKDVEVVYPGVETAKYASDRYPEAPTLGFFYRMNELNGLGILAEAFIKLKDADNVKNLRLRIGGGYTSENKQFIKQIRHLLSPYEKDVDWLETYSLQEHAAFYKSISAICVPITFDEGVGLYLCEAFAAGRPAIEPATGSFPEIIGDAGVLYSPNSAEALASAIKRLFITEWEPCCREALAQSAARYNEQVQAAALHQIYTAI
ncbi:hypothetical protein AGMMS49574_15000 [Bacteroidia bacterium]|nr:hypothetical protein AGMMS49574_15000 [Bacteroidia bacterium]